MRIRKSRRVRLTAVGVFVGIAAAFGLALPTTALADSQADNLQFIIVSDDIRKDTKAVARGAGTEGGNGEEDGAGQDNNGHGNNADGVDMSNPGEGGGGPNAEGADSDPTDDDEAGGGGAAPSKNKGNNGKKK